MIKLKLPRRNTKCHWVVIRNNHHFLFSYSTCVAYNGNLGNCRIENSWGPTTGKHMNEEGVRDYPIVTPEEIQFRMGAACLDAAEKHFKLTRFQNE